MFREMRRIKQKITDSECSEILGKASNGVLSLSGDNGYPYAVPMSFAYSDGKIYFHSAPEGHKIDSIKRNNKVSFCVVCQDDVSPKDFTTLYKSVVVFGKAKILREKEEKAKALLLIAKKYSPDESDERTSEEIDSFIDKVTVIELTCEHISGKKAKELL